MTSDGAHALGGRVFEDIVVSSPSPLETARRLIYVSKWAAGRDNATAICFQKTKTPRPKTSVFEGIKCPLYSFRPYSIRFQPNLGSDRLDRPIAARGRPWNAQADQKPALFAHLLKALRQNLT